jgi:hypothetical protein
MKHNRRNDMTKNKSILITQAVARAQEEIRRPDLECIQAVFVKNAIVLTWADKRSGQRVLTTEAVLIEEGFVDDTIIDDGRN